MERINISFSNQKLSENFSMAEFYLAANPDQEFSMAKPLVDAAQIIRDWVGFQTKVTSTFRPNDSFGFHKTGDAIDLCTPYAIHGGKPPKYPEDVISAFKVECMNYINGFGSKLISNLRKTGVTCFGIECNCIHLDCGKRNNKRFDVYGGYTIFIFRCHYVNGKMIIDENRAI
jgi:hypothetical protein